MQLSVEDIVLAIADHTEGWMSLPELRWLYRVAQQADSVVEIGCWKGRSTTVLGAACNGPVYAVDHFAGSAAERDDTHAEATQRDIIVDFRANTRGIPNLRLIACESLAAVKFLPCADMVFIDGSHEYIDVLADIRAWRPKARKVLAGHDYDWPGVQAAVDVEIPNVKRGPGSIWWVALA